MTDLRTIEEGALEHLQADEGRVEADLDAVAGEDLAEEEAPDRPPVRMAVAVAFPTLAAAIMAGGVFTGVSARVYAAVAGLLGVALAVGASRIRRPTLSNLAVFGGVFAIGLLMVVPSGLGNVFDLRQLVRDAAEQGDVLRPPVPFFGGWRAILGWLLGALGLISAWTAIVLRRPALGLLLPLPVAGIAAISVPESDQVASGIAVLVLFAIGLGVLSSASAVGEGDQRPPLSFELRRAARALPLVAGITVILYILSQSNFLFPDPRYDPAQEPQRPKTTPLSDAGNRVLFTVDSSVTGPWRTGSLDVYDDRDGSWRLPPFAESEVDEVPRSGIVDDELKAGAKATFSVGGLQGSILPGLPNLVGVVARGPKLAFDERNGNLRVLQGQVAPGLEYTVTAAALPTVEQLQRSVDVIPPELRKFTDIPEPPPAVVDLIAQAPKSSRWDTFDYLRTWVLDNVVAAGLGTPKDVPPERIQDMIGGSKEGSPFEIVAAQAMLARWIGLPSRIGYGFDGGEKIEGGRLEVRPRHGASFVEVWFPGFKWLPVIGTPRVARPTVGSDPSTQRQEAIILPSGDIQVTLQLPTVVAPRDQFRNNVQRVVLIVVPLLLLVALIYLLWPAAVKTVLRGRRRHYAEAAGPRARIALAYTEFRDHAIDFGFRHPDDTPLMFLSRFGHDDEHTELAWLVTRALWGDLTDEVAREHVVAAEELSRSLRRRLSQAQPVTMRLVASVSRLSLRHPYAPLLDIINLTRKEPELVPA